MNASGVSSAAATPGMPGRALRGLLPSCTVALVVSVALNVVLAHRIRTITHAQSERVAERVLSVGSSVPPIMAKRLEGQEETISYGALNQGTVLYFFTPPCRWCARNMDNFKSLLDKEGGQYRFIGLSLSEQNLPEYVAKSNLKLPVYSGLASETVKAYKLGSTPQTIVISPEGKVMQDWVGAYAGEQQKQVEAYFHVSLPGLRELPAKPASTN